MAKKKKTPSAKDDLIESLMNDVKVISDQPTVHGPAPKDPLFEEPSDAFLGFESMGNKVGEELDPAAAKLWQGLKEEAPPLPSMGEEKPSDPSVSEDDSQVTFPVGFENPQTPPPADDATVSILNPHEMPKGAPTDQDRTVAVEGFASRQRRDNFDPMKNTGPLRPRPQGSVHASAEATLLQAEGLKIAQQRILELERDLEKYRQENEELASAGEIVRSRCEELNAKVANAEKERREVEDSLNNELLIVKGTSQYKDTELAKSRQKVEDLETRLKADFKKIRVRERELENRLELVKAEKSALLRAKDENILELKRKIDHLQGELDNYRSKVVELNKNIDLNQEQFKRTVRALRVALSNLETKEENVVPIKKAD